MILQIGGLLSGLVSGLTGLVSAAAPAALDIGKAFLNREINRKLNRDRRRQVRAQVRQEANLISPTVALGQVPVPVGGRVTEPVFFPATIIPPSIAPPFTRPAGLFRDIAGLSGFPLGDFGRGGRGVDSLEERRARTMPHNGTGMIFGPAAVARVGGAAAEPRYALNPQTGQAQLFVPGRPGEGMIRLESAVGLELDLSCKYRFNRIKGIFQKVKARRMNPLNFKALGRARTRTSAALRICRTMFTEARRHKTGSVRPKARRRKK